MATLPTGTVSILFTDIEGSTRLLQRLGPDTYGLLLGEHHQVMRAAISACRGVEIKTEGDSFFAIFVSAHDAVIGAVQAQRELAAREWPDGVRVAVRMGIHTGDVQISSGEYVGMDVHRAARISSAAHGGQVLLSGTTAAVVSSVLPDGVALREIGEHLLKDIEAPERLCQLVIDGLPADFPPPHAVATRFELLPAEMTSFVGREEILARAQELLVGTRLLTLTGPGGTGKTRLSIRLARDAAHAYEDGVAFVALASISDPTLVLPTIRHALGLVEQPGRSALETLSERLAGRDVLLVLDNFEQVTDAASSIATLLEAAQELTLVITSRIALHITGEQEFPVPPLDLPTDAEEADLDRLARSEAVALFMQRARAVQPDFSLGPDNAATIREICARLDGLPLAIELAASRVKLLPPGALLARLTKSLDVLQSTAADRTDRQRTLRGAIDWSYGLLPSPEQAVFRRCAIFVGGWRLDDAEPVAGAAGGLEMDLLDGVGALVDHSLVRQVERDSEPRFTMLETIREFGRERLAEAGELDATATAHADRFAALAEQAEPALTAGREWLDRLSADQANIRAALRWLADHDIQRALLMGGRLWRFWHLRGHLREGSGLLTSLLDRPNAAEPTSARAKALIGLAGLVYWQTDFDGARRSYEEALAIARAVGDEAVEVETLYSLAYVRAIERDYAAANRELEAAAELYENQGNSVMATWATATIGMNMSLAGDHDAAIPMLEESISRFETLGEAYGQRNATSVLTRALMNVNQLDEASEANRRVLELSLADQDITSLSAALHDAASLAALSGNLATAATLTGAAERIVDESGGQPPPSLINRIEAMPTLTASLSEEDLEALLARGRSLSTEEAVNLVIARR
ncbi:MAG TPA: adenylate/guanylate cyclase domain-containing protein [Candidatus Limnocylindrales bacterium]|nr:adenylate/guanylate cyclase domain-containing protein [Candidatus Limnocylindrales bacterium]